MVRVQIADIGGCIRRPLEDDICVAATAAGLVGQLPSKDGIRVDVPTDNGGDVLSVLLLGLGVGVPGLLRATEGIYVGLYASWKGSAKPCYGGDSSSLP